MDRNTTSRFHVSRSSWGAQAERMVRRELDKLPMNRFMVAHDIRFKYGNIDHLVIRDDGRVFLIETKSYRGVITTNGYGLYVNGQPLENNPICQINRTIRWIRNIMIRAFGTGCWVTALLVFPAADVRVRWPQKNVLVTRFEDLRWLLSS